MKNLFYFAPINTTEYESRSGFKLLVGAATRKVLSVCSALNNAGSKTGIVSCAVPGKAKINGRWSYLPYFLYTKDNTEIFFCPTVGVPVLSRVFASIGYLYFALFKVGSDDRVVLYNFYPEYIPAALVLNILGNPAVIDVEDAPRSDEKNFRGLLNIFSYFILDKLCAERRLVAADGIASALGISEFLSVYGTVQENELIFSGKKYSNDILTIIYGGTICVDTGLDLFVAAMDLLNEMDLSNGKRINFVVTGFGGENEMRKLQARITNKFLSLNIKSGLSFSDYNRELQLAHAGLCLKMPDSEMGNTTFPSKVIEICAAGLLLITTKVSDVPKLFKETDAIFVRSESPQSLADAISFISHGEIDCHKLAKNGHSSLVSQLSYSAVGSRLKKFLDI